MPFAVNYIMCFSAYLCLYDSLVMTSSLPFLWKLLHRMHQVSQLENRSPHQSAIFFPCFNCHSIIPNNILPLFRRSYYEYLTCILFLLVTTQITEPTALGSDPTSSSYQAWLSTNTSWSCNQSTVYTLTRMFIWWSIPFNFKARINTSLTLVWTTLRVKHTFPSL